MDRVKKAMYLQISDDLRSKIDSEHYKVGDKLPTENELIDLYGVSRVTARRAMDTLAQDDLIIRRPGRGSFVIEKESSNKQAVNAKTEEMIGVIFPTIFPCFGTQLTHEISSNLQERGFHMVYIGNQGNQSTESAALKSIMKLPLDGLIIWPATGRYLGNEIIKLIIDEFPVVMLDRYIQEIETNYVVTDNRQATKKALQHLLDLGHKQIGICSIKKSYDSSIKERVTTATNFLTENGVDFNLVTNVIEVSDHPFANNESIKNSRTQLTKQVKNHLKAYPDTTAFFVTEYYPATLLYEVLTTLGYSVPEDFSIVCYDFPNFYLEDVVQFTHIKQNEAKLARKSVELVLNSIDNKIDKSNHFVEADLIIGETTGQCKGI